jgi:hypothetical protein
MIIPKKDLSVQNKSGIPKTAADAAKNRALLTAFAPTGWRRMSRRLI